MESYTIFGLKNSICKDASSPHIYNFNALHPGPLLCTHSPRLHLGLGSRCRTTLHKEASPGSLASATLLWRRPPPIPLVPTVPVRLLSEGHPLFQVAHAFLF